MKKWTVLLLLAATALPLRASDLDPVARIIEQQRQIEADLGSGALELAPGQAAIIRSEQSKVFGLLRDRSSLGELRTDERVALDLSLQQINAALVGTREADENQRQCRSEKSTGSKMRKVTCRTKREWREIAEEARTFKDRPRICRPPGCGEDPMDSMLRMGGAGPR